MHKPQTWCVDIDATGPADADLEALGDRLVEGMPSGVASYSTGSLSVTSSLAAESAAAAAAEISARFMAIVGDGWTITHIEAETDEAFDRRHEQTAAAGT